MNRPPTSFSHSSRGMTRRPVIGGAPRRGKPFAKCWRSGSARGPPPGVACSVSETLRFMVASRPSYSPATRLSPRRIACSTRAISSQTPAWSSVRSGGFGPVSEYRPGPLQLLRGGDDHRVELTRFSGHFQSEVSRRSPRCQVHMRRTRRSFGGRSSIWCGQGGQLRSWRRSSSPRLERSGTGSSKQT